MVSFKEVLDTVYDSCTTICEECPMRKLCMTYDAALVDFLTVIQKLIIKGQLNYDQSILRRLKNSYDDYGLTK